MSGSRMNVPQMNGSSSNRRPSNLSRNTNNSTQQEKPSNPPPAPQHEYLIKYICDSWNQVTQEVERGTGSGNGRVRYYQEQENHNLKDFQPFDLEAYWGRRLVQNLESNS